MKITYTYKPYWSDSPSEEKTKSIVEFIEDSVDTYDMGQFEQMRESIRAHMKFTDKLVSVLYDKNILSKEDIKTLVSPYIYNIEEGDTFEIIID